MIDEQNYNLRRKKVWQRTILTIATLLIAAILIWIFFIKSNNQPSTKNPVPIATNSNTPATSVTSLISYSLPAGWNSVKCSNPSEVILIVPDGKVSPNCATLADSWPTKLSIDLKNTRDCNQIKVNNQQITSHTCLSKIINGNKVLVSKTSFNSQSAYGKNTDATDYYVITKNGVVNLQYSDDLSSPDDDYQAEFDQIANSIRAK